jgi:hypothetical protein
MTTKAGLQTPRGSRPLALLALVAIVPLLVLGAVLTQWYAAREQGEIDLQLQLQLQRAAGRTASAVSRELQAQVDLLSIVAESPRLDFPLQSKSFGEIADRLGFCISALRDARRTDIPVRGGNFFEHNPNIPIGEASCFGDGARDIASHFGLQPGRIVGNDFAHRADVDERHDDLLCIESVSWLCFRGKWRWQHAGALL